MKNLPVLALAQSLIGLGRAGNVGVGGLVRDASASLLRDVVEPLEAKCSESN